MTHQLFPVVAASRRLMFVSFFRPLLQLFSKDVDLYRPLTSRSILQLIWNWIGHSLAHSIVFLPLRLSVTFDALSKAYQGTRT